MWYYGTVVISYYGTSVMWYYGTKVLGYFGNMVQIYYDTGRTRGGVVVKAYPTNGQVAGSIPDGVIGIFQ